MGEIIDFRRGATPQPTRAPVLVEFPLHSVDAVRAGLNYAAVAIELAQRAMDKALATNDAEAGIEGVEQVLSALVRLR